MNISNTNIERELLIESSTKQLSNLRNFVKEFSGEVGFQNDEINKIILAVDEACTNIIKHAYKFSPQGEIKILMKTSNNKLKIVITDSGAHFNPDLIPEPNISELYKQRKVGGLGMYLMKKLMDEVKYESGRDSNKVTLIKKIPQS